VAGASGIASAGLGAYDGSAGTLVDTNVWLDCIDTRSAWHDWSIDRLQACAERSPLHINPIVYAELLAPRPDPRAVDALLAVFDTQRSPLPWACCMLAAHALALYRRRGGTRSRTLPDFFIGAHAAVANLSVLTRDRAAYASYFPRLAVLAP
jgi:predicted nucleic acid-binding protein